MARDERFKKAQQAGADWLETARERAEEFLRELSKAGDTTQGRGKDALDDLLDSSRKGTEQLLTSIRKEVNAQLGLLGIATKADLAALEARLKRSGTAGAAPAKKAAAKKTAAKKAAPTKKSPAKRAPAKKSPAKAAAKKTSG